MAKVKVAVYGSPLKTVYIDTSVGTRLDALQTQLNALSAAGTATRHSSLQGLQLGDDHPQYTMWAAPETITATWNFNNIPLIQGESLAEYIEDVVGGDSFIQDTVSIHWTYNDTAGTLEGNVQDEYVQDTVGAMLTDSSRIDFTYNDASGTFTADLIADSVANSFLADMSQATIKGRASGAGTGNPVDLTGTEATAILDTFTDSLKGLAPASGGGTTNFLRADGSWATPTSGGSVSKVQVNNLTITSNNVLQDTDLVIPLTAGTWLVTLDVMQTQNSTPQMETQIQYTGTVTSVAGIVTRMRSTTATSVATFTALPYSQTETTSDTVGRRISMRLTVSDSGNVKVQARQVNSSGTAVNFLAGSNMQAVQIS